MNISEIYKDNIQVNQSNSLILILLSIITVIGITTLFIPIQIVLLLTLFTGLMIFFVFKPEYCYYSLIFTIPFTERLRILPISFSLNDVIILVCSIAVFLSAFLRDDRVSLKTSMDKWIIVLLALYFAAGITSISNTGILASFKFLEAIIVFYLTVYFIRSKRVTISKIIKILLFTALLQASLGILQSLTGSFGAWFQSQRGYLGYLGIGSKTVWHGVGTMGQFNMLGNFLTTLLLFFLPIYHYVIKNKIKGKIILLILLFGIITTYSRGSLIGLFFGFLYFSYLTIKNKIKFTLFLGFTLVIASLIYFYFNNTSYVQTLTYRNQIWEVVITSILNNPYYIWIGAGLNSYWEVVGSYIPSNIPLNQYYHWFAHNFYLLCIQEVGVIGTSIIFSFLIFIFIKARFNFMRVSAGFLRFINLSNCLVVFSIFFVSLTDHAYSLTFFKIMLFLMLGLSYSKKPKTSKRGYYVN